ncbi:xylanase [Mobilitalea sibirica]|uniref:Xylanase n=1 Tax=Mobilitalea sibirica TaxID=1462919 RepID=A0A8J7H4U0_9FIRM|nr:glycosyl hydrolase family 8 [Mobilitalea sibirica]MBH1941549.1 xylanase [Mobilitalea sibirica]
MKGAFYTGEYRNLFKEFGYDEDAIEKKVEEAYQTIFYGPDEERFYHEVGNDMAYFEDTGNHDARTEGMSYAMMMCVQRDWKKEFDRLWNFSKTYMWMESGYNSGYFAWSVQPDGTKNALGPAPDGEEYFAMALFFASHRWGDGEGIYNYSKEAKAILHECVHKGENGTPGDPMWEPSNKLIKFIPNCDFTDPSYHLPHFYELFAEWADPEDREFWKEAAAASREYLHKACHPVTGLAPEYSHYDGSPYRKDNRERYYSDAYRVPANLGLDYEWFGKDEWQSECADKIQTFFCETVKGKSDLIYEIDGSIIEEKALHPVAIIATNAQASLASKGKYQKECVELFWNTPLRKGDRRYYDNCLYLFALLALSGNYRIWK